MTSLARKRCTSVLLWNLAANAAAFTWLLAPALGIYAIIYQLLDLIVINDKISRRVEENFDACD